MIIGVIGGGQLGMMMAESMIESNHTIIGLDPNKNCPLSHVAEKIIVAEYSDGKAIEKLYSMSDVVTYEFENVDLDLIKKYEDKTPQKSDALYYSRNRLIEKNFAMSLGIETPKYIKYSQNNVFYPSIIKTTTGGYDGKGQWVIRSKQDIDRFTKKSHYELIVEEFVDFDYEISVIATRDIFGTIVYYPIPINEHKNGILFTSSVLGEIEDSIVLKAQEFTKRILEKLDYVGTLAVEYFVKEGNVIFNEFAPRPHNSGHYTIEGCSVSQFENHMLAIMGEKVLEVMLIKPTIMINVLGQDNDYIERTKGLFVYHHDYKKDVPKVNRKMGHITLLANNKEDAIQIKRKIIKE